VKTQKYVTMRKKIPANLEKNASKIELDRDGSQVNSGFFETSLSINFNYSYFLSLGLLVHNYALLQVEI